MNKSPFEFSYNGESLDKDFFKRLKRFENHFEEKSTEDSIYLTCWITLKKINSILKEEMIYISQIEKAIEVYNLTNSKEKTIKSWWYDVRLHLRHLAYVYGIEYETDSNLNLIKKVHNIS